MTTPEPQNSNGTTIAVPMQPVDTSNATTAGTTTNGLVVSSTGTNGSPSFTIADIEAARQQEKDKLYPKLSQMEEQLKTFAKERDERLAAEEKARILAEKTAEEERLKNLTFEQKLAETEQTWASKFADVQQQVAQRDALLEREREYQQLQEFRNRRLGEEAEHIMPEMHSWVAGASEDDIEAAISRAKETTASILAQVTQAQQAQAFNAQQARQQARGTGVTAPPVGPMDNQTGYETLTADQIAAMDMTTYAKNRARLLGAASQQMRGRG